MHLCTGSTGSIPKREQSELSCHWWHYLCLICMFLSLNPSTFLGTMRLNYTTHVVHTHMELLPTYGHNNQRDQNTSGAQLGKYATMNDSARERERERELGEMPSVLARKRRINQLNWVRTLCAEMPGNQRQVGERGYCETVWQFKQQNSTNQQWKPQKSTVEIVEEQWIVVPWLLMPVQQTANPPSPVHPFPTLALLPVPDRLHISTFMWSSMGVVCVVDFLLKRCAIQFQILLNTFPRVAESRKE